MDVSRCAPSVLYAYDLGALWVSGWMPGPRTPPGAQSCADTPTRVRAHRRANPVNETLSVQFSSGWSCTKGGLELIISAATTLPGLGLERAPHPTAVQVTQPKPLKKISSYRGVNPGPFAYDARWLTATPRRVVQSVFGFA